MQARISALLLNYNQRDYYSQVVQNYVPRKKGLFELVIVDDGSTDGSVELFEKLAQKHAFIRLIKLGKNQGVEAAIAAGIEATKGEYVHIGAMDDVIHGDFFQENEKMIHKYPEAPFVFSDPSEFHSDFFDKKRTVTIDHKFDLSTKPCFFSSRDIIALFKKKSFTFPSNACIFHKKSLMAIGGFRPELSLYADVFASTLLSVKGGAAYLPGVYTSLCIRGNSIFCSRSKVRGKKEQAFLRTLDVLKTEYPACYKIFKQVAIILNTDFRMLWLLMRSKKYRDYVTSKLIRRYIVFNGWYLLKKHLPTSFHVFVRRRIGRALQKIVSK